MNPTSIAKSRWSVDRTFPHCSRLLIFLVIQRNGTAAPSFTSLAFDNKENMTEQEDFDLKWTTNSMYTGSIDTVRSRSSRPFPRTRFSTEARYF